jgi:hypothetical protein
MFMLQNKDLNVLPYKDIFQLMYKYKSIYSTHICYSYASFCLIFLISIIISQWNQIIIWSEYLTHALSPHKDYLDEV